MKFTQPELPYPLKALVPFISEEQMHYHYHKHHATYFKSLNSLMEGRAGGECSLEEVVKQSSGGLFNNAAQAWNHTFFWNCMSPGGGGRPSGHLMCGIERSFGSFECFIERFEKAAVTLFGSGWVWLVSDGTKLEILPLSNADTPLKFEKMPLLTLDVWEHAYYIDYRNDRLRFVKKFLDVVHWAFVSQCYEKIG